MPKANTKDILPVGSVVPYAGLTDQPNRDALQKAGWLLCDGKAVSRKDFAILFEVIGDIHGRGDASTSFNLPDYRGRFLRGVDDGIGRDPEAAQREPAATGGLAGDRVGSVQPDAFRAHSHAYTWMKPDNNVDGVDSVTIHSGEHHNEGNITESAGGKETRPINANVHWIIYAGKK